jgi:thioredoxin 1
VVSVDHNAESAARFGIRSIPTMILFKKGEVVDVLAGAQSKAKLSRLLQKAAKPRGAGFMGLFRK